MHFIWGECNTDAIYCRFHIFYFYYEIIVVEKCACVAVYKRSAEEDSKAFAVYAGDKILQFTIVNMQEVLASEAVQSNP